MIVEHILEMHISGVLYSVEVTKDVLCVATQEKNGEVNLLKMAS